MPVQDADTRGFGASKQANYWNRTPLEVDSSRVTRSVHHTGDFVLTGNL
jgi:hypothetical protein